MYNTIKLEQGDIVGIGICDAVFANVRTVTKRDYVVQEFLAFELARLFSIPVPPGFLAQEEDGTWLFASVFVGPNEAGVEPVDTYTLDWDKFPNVRKQFARISAFDKLIGNSDRHLFNMVWTGPDSIAAIDHGLTFLRKTFHPTPFYSEICEDEGRILRRWVNSSLIDAANEVFSNAVEIFEGSDIEVRIVKRCLDTFEGLVYQIREWDKANA